MLPQFQCIKKVRAGKIVEIARPIDTTTGEVDLKLVAGKGTHHTVRVTMGYVNQHRPQVGGYFVEYDGGHQSFSPADVFEKGYVELPQFVPF